MKPDITRLLERWSDGDPDAEEHLIVAVYGDLRSLAASILRGERPGHTLQPTELVHEVFLKLSGSKLPSFENRGHFFSIAARSMRQLLVDHARAYARQKRFDPALRAPLDPALLPSVEACEEVLAIHHALEALSAEHPRYGRVVELRYFGGFSLEETAKIIGVARATVARDWSLARALLSEKLDGSALRDL